MAKEKLKEYFKRPGTIAKWWNPEEEYGKYREYYILQRLDVMRLVEPRDKIILDVGTGKGRFAVSFFHAGAKEVVAVDISREMMNVAKKKIEDAKLPVSLCICDAEYLPFREKAFDVVCCMQTFPHLPNPIKAMSEFVYVLKGDGVVVADAIVYRVLYRLLRRSYFHKSMIPLRYLAYSFLGKQLNELEYHSVRVVNDFSKNDFVSMFRRAALKIEQTRRRSIFLLVIAKKTS